MENEAMSQPAPEGAYLPSRRRWLGGAACCVLGALAGLAGGQALAAPWATACEPALSAAASELRARALEGLDPGALWDTHCHLLGNGDAGSGCYLHPSLTSGFNVVERLRRRAILDAACVASDAESVDRAYMRRLVQLALGFPPGARWLLFAFEQAYDDAGRADPQHTTVHVPDRYAAAMAAAHPQHFGWVASIHPYRTDAIEALQTAHAGGAAAIKWLPSAMNIDLRDARSGRFAERAAALGLPLIVHCGEEHAVPGARRDDLVNPLHVRALLERGASVIVAHCASLGVAADIDKSSAPKVPAFDLFVRLMGERAHGERLRADISGAFQFNRKAPVWRTLLQRDDWAPRLLHGSDYPLPGLKPLVSLPRLVEAQVLPEADVQPLVELREHNPLLFDLALKRSLRLGHAKFAGAIFATRGHFRDPAQASPRKEEPRGDTGSARR
jgi:mannonate dehydratase